MFKKLLSKYRKRKKWKQFNNFLPFLVVFGVLLILESGYFLARNELSQRLPFGVKIANTDFGLVEAEAATAELKILVQKFSQQPLRFKLEDEILEILPAEVDLNFAIERKIGVLKNQLVNFGTVEIPTSLNEKRLRKLLLAKFPELEYSPTDAKVFLGENGKLAILPEKSGHKTDFEKIATEVRKIAGRFSDEILKIEDTEIPPKVLASQLEPFREELRKIIAEKLILKKTEYERFEIDLTQRIAWFDFKENGKLHLFLKPDEINKFVEKELNLLVGELPHDTAIT
ncbi:peptidoglycan binding domain-containing protein, partial [Candidatus Gracilibacteria bacterium]|nr:peptidoglycan binding domain-containing protein [Candidatus Gracilibacteria bacterium]